MHKTHSLGYTRAETEDSKKIIFCSQKWGLYTKGLYTRHYSNCKHFNLKISGLVRFLHSAREDLRSIRFHLVLRAF